MPAKSVRELVEDALDAFDDPSAEVAGLVRRAIRIATKRQDYVALLRLYPETIDFNAGEVDHPALDAARANLTALLGKDEAEALERAAMERLAQCRSHKTRESGKIYAQSIGQLESSLAQLSEAIEGYKTPPQNLTPVDTYFVAKEYEAASAKLMPIRRDLQDVIERIKQMVHDFLVETERQTEQGQSRPDVFERSRAYIERGLRDLAPEALDKFHAVEASLASGSSEDLSHALTSCRRVIKALADALYPATNQVIVGVDGQERTMSDDAYRNRLLQFANERLGNSSTHQAAIKETLRSLGARLARLNEMSSKGVHDEVSHIEAETCVLWTYLTAADFLRIADGSTPKPNSKAED